VKRLLCLLLFSSVAYAAPPKKPRVVVTLVVDQLGAWVLNDRIALLPGDGGFQRLLREGTYVREIVYHHAATETAPGHAALYTGAPPRDNGIVTNERFEITAGKYVRVPALLDDKTREVDSKGVSDRPSASLIDLTAEVLADRVRIEQPLAHVFALSLKDRGAIFAGGHRPDASIWFDVAIDDIVTSTALGQSLPAWAISTFQTSRSLRGPSWIASIPAGKLPAYVVDKRLGEGNLPGDSSVFPHRVTSAAAFRASPYGDRFLFDLGLAALDSVKKTRAKDGPTLLAISLSSNDYVSHIYGSDSLEAYEELFALDRALGQFESGLDDRFGKNGWAIVLSADHGSTPLPETPRSERTWCAQGAPHDHWDRPCEAGRRVDQEGLGVAIEKAVADAVGKNGLVVGVADPYVYLSDAARDPSVRPRVISAATAALKATPGVAEVFDTTALPKTCPSNDDLPALVCRAVSSPEVTGRGRAGDLYVVLDAGSFFDSGHSRGRGGSHGTPYPFNRAVPLLVRAPGWVQEGKTIEAALPFSSFVRTAAALLGITAPKNAVPGTALVVGTGSTPASSGN
jgi:arylsulfatase A-like enzyme